MMARCIVCGADTRRKPNPKRPCCRKCEKTAPTAVSSPGLFTRGPAALIAKAAMRAVEEQEEG
jgi:hypothetical protein